MAEEMLTNHEIRMGNSLLPTFVIRSINFLRLTGLNALDVNEDYSFLGFDAV